MAAKNSASKPVVSVASATDNTDKTVSTSNGVGADLTDEQLFAMYEARKASRGKPLLNELKTVEDRANEIRIELQKLNIPAPPRIIVNVSEEDINHALLALYRVPNNAGMTLTNLERFTEFPQSRMAGVRSQLDTDPASIAYKVVGGKGGKVVYLTKEGLQEAEGIAATDEGKALIAAIDKKIVAAKEAAAKAKG